MKDYIYKRIKDAEYLISEELNWCIKYRKAKDIDFKAIVERVMRPLQIKSMPQKYKEQVWSILWFCYNREVTRYFMYPVAFKGKLYSKWEAMPEECKEMLRNSPSGDNRPYPVFTWHFTEGMDDEGITI